MTRKVFIAATLVLLLGTLSVFADEAVLMDFSLLKADTNEDPLNPGQFLDNGATVMDFSTTAGASYTEDQKKQMATSLAIGNWDITLASSSRTNFNQALSYTREAPVIGGAYTGKTVMGIRVHFPTETYNSWAMVTPPFSIPAFERKEGGGSDPVNDRLTRFEGTYNADTKITTAMGIVKNVGVIKSLAVTVRGMNFPHGISLVLEDEEGKQTTMFMGYLNFDGWKELRWDNPAYVTDVRNRELRLFPLYPKSSPFVKLAGILITRDAAHEGGDFVTYVKDVKILYDKAVLDPVRDIDDEAVWGINDKREADRKLIESRRFGESQVLRYLERLKQEPKSEFTSDTE